MEFLKMHIGDIVVVAIIVILVVLAIRKIISDKGRCVYCDKRENCILKKLKK